MSVSSNESVLKIRREDLYNQIWKTPIPKLARRYKMTKQQLVSVCEHINVPYPPRGYWEKVRRADFVEVISLPTTREKIGIITINPLFLSLKDSNPNLELEKLYSYVPVANRLLFPHPAVRSLLNKYKNTRRKAFKETNLWAKYNKLPAMTLTDRRRLYILDALFKNLDQYGARSDVKGEGRFFVSYGGASLEFQLREVTKLTHSSITSDQKRWYSFDHNEARQMILHTGRLNFRIHARHSSGIKTRWFECKDLRIEGCLSEIIEAIISHANYIAGRSQRRVQNRRVGIQK